MLEAFVYILKCSDGSFYVGSTTNLDKRLSQHKSGKGANYTQGRLPVQLVYFEVYDRIDTAFYREQQIKKWSRGKKQALIDKNYDLLHELAKCNNIASHFNK